MKNLETRNRWRKLRINKKFLQLLQEHHPTGVTNQEAYELYIRNCATIETLRRAGRRAYMLMQLGYQNEILAVAQVDSFLTMNVRNQLSALAHHGVLKRIEPGKYEWDPQGFTIHDIDNINTWVRENVERDRRGSETI